MTDEMREQIERDADAYVKRQGTHNRPDLTHHDFTKGATHQHYISYEAGKKDGIDLCISRMKELFKIIANGEQNFVLKELDALKTKKV